MSLSYCHERVALTRAFLHKEQAVVSSPPESKTHREDSDDDLLEVRL